MTLSSTPSASNLLDGGGAPTNSWLSTIAAQQAAAGVAPAPTQAPTGMAGLNLAPAPTAAPAATPAVATAPAVASTPSAAPTPAPTAAPSTAPAPAAATATYADVQNWYRNGLGRDATPEEIQYHLNNIAQYGADAAWNGFQQGATANGERVLVTDRSAAQQAYTGYQSQNGNSMIDDWARNVFGRDATASELAQYGGATSAADAESKYAAFLAAGQQGGEVPIRPMTMEQASLLKPPAATPAPYETQMPPGYGDMSLHQFPADLNHQVDPKTMTIEGRINNLTAMDAQGNYTNPVVRQAAERAMQEFAARGLTNSSMAVQAAIEAATSKAIEIAGPDAQTYFAQSRANQDARNVFARDEMQQNYTERNNMAEWAHSDATQKSDQDFRLKFLSHEQAGTLRQNYLEAVDHTTQRYTDMVNQINASNMTPEDKTAAIAQAGTVRDGDLVYWNNLFAAQPGFAREWMTATVATSADDIAGMTNRSTLQNIINDTAQPQALRDAARARLTALGPAPPPPSPTPRPAPAYEGGGGGGGDGGV